jgi:uncharacterized protein YwqG
MSILSSLFGFRQKNIDRIKQHIIESKYELESFDKLEIIDLIKPAIGVRTKSIKDNKVKVGKSKIGGNPDIPVNFEWPKFKNEYLTFCAQYNLSELGEYDLENCLPKKGMLYVFVFIDKDYPGFMCDESSYKIIYLEDIDTIQRLNFPESYFLGSKFQVAEINYFEYFTLPDDENYKLKKFHLLYDNFYDFYENIVEFIDSLTGENIDNYHQVLGEDKSVQSSVGFDFAVNILQIKTTEDFESKQDEIKEIEKKHRILLQLDCNDRNSNLSEYGGNMVMYFGIKPEHLIEQNFDNVIMAFQGT